jgi:hypothetical protein
MPPKYIEVNGEVIEFPGDMTDEQIEMALGAQSVALSESMANAPTSGFMMGLKDPISGAAQLVPRGLAYATSLGGNVENPVSRFLSEEARRVDEMVRQEQAAYMQNRAAAGESGFDLGRLAGNVFNPASIIPATRAAGLFTRAAPATRAVIGGAVSGSMQPVTGEDFAEEKAKQIALGGALGAGGQVVFSALGRAANPLISKAEQTMRDLGVVPTTGQTLGKGAKSLEEFAQYMPLIGPAIRDARQRTLFDFNKGVINSALGRVKDKLPEDVIGRDAIEYATGQISNAYDDVLSKMKFELDFNTSSNILSALNKAKLLSAEQRQSAIDYVNEIALTKFSGRQLTGAEYKAIESDLRKKAANLMASQTASEREVGDALFGVLSEFKKSLYNQNPKLTPSLRRVDAAYADMAAIKLAAANSGAVNGVFTPKQFATAVRQNDKTLNKSAYARGTARSQQISDSAMQVLGEEAGETLAGRYTAGTAGLFGVATNPSIAIPAGFATRALYTEPGQRAMDVLLRSRPELMRRAGGLFQSTSPYTGAVAGPQPVFQYNVQERQPQQ